VYYSREASGFDQIREYPQAVQGNIS